MTSRGEVREQRLTFDDVAVLYDQARPRYPDSLVEDVLALSGIRAGGRVLEIGCGTGQATASFARRNVAMTCLEPGMSMSRLARERLAAFANVTIVNQSFEDWSGEPEAFDLVISAQALHWVTPEVRFVKAAHVLRPGGALAVFGHNVVFDKSSAIRQAMDVAYAECAPSLTGSTTDWYSAEGPLRALFAESGCFGPVTHRCHSWLHRYTSGEYLDLISTYSDHRLLPAVEREALFAAVHAAIESHGGGIDVRYDAHLHLAHR